MGDEYTDIEDLIAIIRRAELHLTNAFEPGSSGDLSDATEDLFETLGGHETNSLILKVLAWLEDRRSHVVADARPIMVFTPE